jgi:osmotically-inducible protein OsmY
MAIATENRTDVEIQADVLEELRWEPRVHSTEIGVTVKNGVVTLAGYVDSYTKRWAAEDATRRVRGVQAVVNDIEVKLPGSSERTDPDIAEAVLRALKWDPFVPQDRIQVTVSKGWVTLKGNVDWRYQREDAERAVRHIYGVKGVTNLITVKPRVTPSDLKRQIEQALIRNAETDAKRITVDVDGSRVILKGTVRSWLEKDAAERAAWQAPGITEVDNRIVIAP